MRKKLFGGSILPAIILAAAVLAYVWFLSRPPEPFDPAELTPAEPPLETYPSQVSLSCQPIRSSTALSLTFENHTDRTFYHGDSPDYERLDVELEGRWYTIPSKPYSTAGVGRETGPGASFTYEPLLDEGYGDLPDGRYRICFGIWDVTSRGDAPLGEPDGIIPVCFTVEQGKFAAAPG